MNKKAEFDIQSFLITFLVISGMLVTLGTVAYNMGQNYQTIGTDTVSSSFKDSYDLISEVESKTEDLEGKMSTTAPDNEDNDQSIFTDAINSVKLIVPAIKSSFVIIFDMGEALEIPSIWIRVMTTGLIIMILTTLIFMFFKSRGTT